MDQGRARGRCRGRGKQEPDKSLTTQCVLQARGQAKHKLTREEPATPTSLAREVSKLSVTKKLGRKALERISYANIKSRPKELITKRGKTGQTVKLQANFFQLETHPSWALYQYRVDFAPDEERTSMKKQLLRPHKEIFSSAYLFDGTVLYACSRLKSDLIELFSLRETDQQKIRITIKFVGDVVMGDYQYIQVFNIIMRKCLDNLHLQMVGRDFFDAKARIEIREYRMELWPGYLTSIRQCEDHILMNAEITYKVMRCETGLDLIHKCRSSEEWERTFENAIMGTIVLTDYNNRTYRIDDVDFKCTPMSKFKLKNGEQSTYCDYYKQRYGIKIREPNQPMLVSKSKPRDVRAGMSEIIYLVPELCRLTGLTDDMRTNFQLMKALAEHTRVVPKLRVEKLMKFNHRLKETKEVEHDLASWNMNLADSLVQFEGRVLPMEKIFFGGNTSVNSGPDADWTRSMRNNAMLATAALKCWAIVYLGKSKSEVNNFLSTLAKAAETLKFRIPVPAMREVINDRCSSYVEALEAVISRSNPQLILCVVPNNRADRYAAIKKKCCVDRAVPTQVVLAKNFSSKNIMAIATKIAIQINCKLGGIPWSISNPLKGLMVIGYDVCHDAARKDMSYGAMVASLNQSLSRYYSSVTPHTHGEELSNDLAFNIIKALLRYKESNEGNLPSMIIIYRDGVGEGQLPFVYSHEVQIIKDRLKEVYVDRSPKFGFVIVTKRLNTRLFLNGGNPPPGTLADDCITNPDRYDFFLVSQSVRQGTVSPTSFNVIDDSTGLDADRMQRLTYKMTHLYFNWSGTIRVPAQCQYAHKLAFLISQCLHRPPNTELDDLLYFL